MCVFVSGSKVKRTFVRKCSKVKKTSIRKGSGVRKTSVGKGSKLLDMGIWFDAPFLDTWDFSNMMQKILFDETRGTSCSEYRKRLNKFSCVYHK